MANQINTRIMLKYDSFQNWKDKNPTLLAGEVAIAKLTTTHAVAPGSDSQAPVLFKVGPGAFNSLPWVSGLAADVYAWAKKETPDWTDFPALPLEVVDTGTGKFVTDFTYADNKLTITRSDVAWADVTGAEDGVEAYLEELGIDVKTSVGPDGEDKWITHFSAEQAAFDKVSFNEATLKGKDVATEEYVGNQLAAIDYDEKLAESGITVSRGGEDSANPGAVYEVSVPSLVAMDLQVRNTSNGKLEKVATENYVDTKVGDIADIDVNATTKPTDIVGAINTVRAELEDAINAGGSDAAVTVEKQATATDGSLATYVVKQNNTQVGDKIEVVVDSDLTERVDRLDTFVGDAPDHLTLSDITSNIRQGATVTVEATPADEVTIYEIVQGNAGGMSGSTVGTITVVDAYKKSEADAKFTTPAQVLSTVDKALADVASADTITGITTLVEYVNDHGSDLAAITNEIYGKDSIDTTGESRIDKAIADSSAAVGTANTASSVASGAAATASEAKQIAEGAASTANDAKTAAVTAQNSASASAQTATEKASAASQSASDAAQSASDAAAAKQAAEKAKADAESAKSAAASSESNANNAASAAMSFQEGAQSAASQAGTAKTKAEAAQAAAEAAQAAAEASNTSATAIANEAKQAAEAATQASNTATQTVSNLKALAFKDKVTPADFSADTFIFYCGTATELVD